MESFRQAVGQDIKAPSVISMNKKRGTALLAGPLFTRNKN
jgi:hypothetical protein